MLTSAMRTWPWASRSTLFQLGEVVFADVQHDAFADHRDAIPPAIAHPFDDGADERVDHHLQPQRWGEFLGNERQCRARCLRDAEAQVARRPAHRNDEVPARGRLGVHHQVLDDLDAVVTRRLKSECVDMRRQVEVVVDGFRHVHNPQPSGCMLG